MSHTPEPWKLDEYGTVSDSSGQIIGNPANSRRIVACVNACAGISNVDLELGNSAFIDRLKQVITLEQQRDSLRTALTTQAEEAAKLMEQRDELISNVPRAAQFIECYIDFIKRTNPVEFEEHPYLPEMEEVAADLRAAIAKAEAP